ncbi:MAG: hypothetical protein ACREXI_03945, partial [Caldimonas sp.]
MSMKMQVALRGALFPERPGVLRSALCAVLSRALRGAPLAARSVALRVALCSASLAALLPADAAALPLEMLRVPPGFHVELLTDAVPNARAMALGRHDGARGVVYVGSMRAGKVYAVEFDRGRAGAVHTIASGLALPAGVAYR